MNALTGKYSAALFWFTFIIVRFNHYLPRGYAFIFSLFIYLISGGWRYARACIRTLRRDLFGISVLCRCLFPLLMMKRRGHGIREKFAAVVKFRGRNSLSMLCGHERWTFGDLDDYSNQVGHFLFDKGIQKAENIALFMESCPKYVGTWLGAGKMGIATGLINSNLRQDSLVAAISQISPRALFVGASLTKFISEANIAGDLPAADLVLFASNLGERKSSENIKHEVFYVLLSDILLKYPKTNLPYPKSPATLSDVLVYVFTSGTTGLPKAAIITTSRYMYMCSAVHYFTRIRSDDIFYTPLPLYHSAGGIVGAGQMVIHGITLVVRPRFSASQFWSDCVEYNVTVVQYVGEVCRFLLCQPVRKEEKEHKVRLIVGNGLRRQVWIDFVKRFNIPQVGELYGATESNSSLVNSENKLGAIGFTSIILPWVYPINLVKTDPETGEVLRDPNTGFCITCAFGEAGQLVGRINRNNPMRNFEGYINRKESSRKILRDVFSRGDAYFLSGDMLIQDDEGFFYFIDRLGDTFRWRGENVSTTEVENIVAKVIEYADCVVYAVEIPGNEGRAGMLCLATHSNPNANDEAVRLTQATTSEKLILNDLAVTFAAQLPTYARPLFIRFSKAINTTDTFKFRKVELVRENFNPDLVSDNIYYLDSKANIYLLLDKTIYSEILNGKIRF